MFAAFVVYWLWIGQHVRTHTGAHIQRCIHRRVCNVGARLFPYKCFAMQFHKIFVFLFTGYFFPCFFFLFWASELTNGSRLTERAMLLFIKPYDAHISPHTQYTCTHPCTNTMHTQKTEQVRNACREFYTLDDWLVKLILKSFSFKSLHCGQLFLG